MNDKFPYPMANPPLGGAIAGGAIIGRIDLPDQVGNPGQPRRLGWLGGGIQPNDQIVGTCSKCRGPVCVPGLVGSVIPPVPTCRHCGAKKKSPHGPVIEME